MICPIQSLQDPSATADHLKASLKDARQQTLWESMENVSCSHATAVGTLRLFRLTQKLKAWVPYELLESLHLRNSPSIECHIAKMTDLRREFSLVMKSVCTSIWIRSHGRWPQERSQSPGFPDLRTKKVHFAFCETVRAWLTENCFLRTRQRLHLAQLHQVNEATTFHGLHSSVRLQPYECNAIGQQSACDN